MNLDNLPQSYNIDDMGYGGIELFKEDKYDSSTLYPGYKIISSIGQGFFGKVYKAKRLSDGKIIALKVIHVDPLKPNMLQTIEKEALILSKISRPQCQPFLVCFNDYIYLEDYNDFLIDMNLIEGKTLGVYANEIKDDKTRYRHLLLIMKDIVKAISYLHNNGIIHNDIKPDNIIIDKHLTPILVDFGVACLELSVCPLDDKVSSLCCKGIKGPHMYISPETLKTKAYFTQSDIWSLGITFYTAATGGKHPFVTDSVRNLYTDIIKNKPDKLNTSNEILNYIVNRALDKNPVTRITISEISDILSDM